MKAGPKASVDDSPLTGRRVGQGYNAALEIRTVAGPSSAGP
jgi:hypothetical protein